MRLEAEMDDRMRSAAERRAEEMMWPAFKKEKDDAELVINSRRGVFKQAEYNAILRCLHPDTNPTIEQKNEAFRFWHERKLVLLSARNDPRQYRELPTLEELIERVLKADEERKTKREKAKEERKAKREAAKREQA